MSITDELRAWAEGDTLRAGMSLRTARDQALAIADRIDAEHEESIQREHESAYDAGYAEGMGVANKADMRAEYLRGKNAGYDEGWDAGFASADDWCAQHEDAMAEHGWVRGPLDADGEMWHCGDMSDSNWGVIEGIAYENGRWLISGHDMSAPWIPADSIRHHHEPTVEDVLREFSEKMNENLGMYTGEAIDADEWRQADSKTIAEYAAKLKLAEGEDA